MMPTKAADFDPRPRDRWGRFLPHDPDSFEPFDDEPEDEFEDDEEEEEDLEEDEGEDW